MYPETNKHNDTMLLKIQDQQVTAHDIVGIYEGVKTEWHQPPLNTVQSE